MTWRRNKALCHKTQHFSLGNALQHEIARWGDKLDSRRRETALHFDLILLQDFMHDADGLAAGDGTWPCKSVQCAHPHFWTLRYAQWIIFAKLKSKSRFQVYHHGVSSINLLFSLLSFKKMKEEAYEITRLSVCPPPPLITPELVRRFSWNSSWTSFHWRWHWHGSSNFRGRFKTVTRPLLCDC
jgi:hypothetical protein